MPKKKAAKKRGKAPGVTEAKRAIAAGHVLGRSATHWHIDTGTRVVEFRTNPKTDPIFEAACKKDGREKIKIQACAAPKTIKRRKRGGTDDGGYNVKGGN